MNSWDKDIKKLQEANPKTQEELCGILGISELSPEGYYASLVFEWMSNFNQETDMPTLTNTVGYKAHATRIMSDPSTSDWLRDAVYNAWKRDIVDAYHDALALAQLLAEGVNEVLPAGSPMARVSVEEKFKEA